MRRAIQLLFCLTACMAYAVAGPSRPVNPVDELICQQVGRDVLNNFWAMRFDVLGHDDPRLKKLQRKMSCFPSDHKTKRSFLKVDRLIRKQLVKDIFRTVPELLRIQHPNEVIDTAHYQLTRHITKLIAQRAMCAGSSDQNACQEINNNIISRILERHALLKQKSVYTPKFVKERAGIVFGIDDWKLWGLKTWANSKHESDDMRHVLHKISSVDLEHFYWEREKEEGA